MSAVRVLFLFFPDSVAVQVVDELALDVLLMVQTGSPPFAKRPEEANATPPPTRSASATTTSSARGRRTCMRCMRERGRWMCMRDNFLDELAPPTGWDAMAIPSTAPDIRQAPVPCGAGCYPLSERRAICARSRSYAPSPGVLAMPLAVIRAMVRGPVMRLLR